MSMLTQARTNHALVYISVGSSNLIKGPIGLNASLRNSKSHSARGRREIIIHWSTRVISDEYGLKKGPKEEEQDSIIGQTKDDSPK